jgi:hypothetical protein
MGLPFHRNEAPLGPCEFSAVRDVAHGAREPPRQRRPRPGRAHARSTLRDGLVRMQGRYPASGIDGAVIETPPRPSSRNGPAALADHRLLERIPVLLRHERNAHALGTAANVGTDQRVVSVWPWTLHCNLKAQGSCQASFALTSAGFASDAFLEMRKTSVHRSQKRDQRL